MIEQQFEDLKDYLEAEKHLEAEFCRLATGALLFTVKGVPIKEGWNRRETDVLFIAPPGYPAAKPDCFWVSPRLRLGNGAMPKNSNEGSAIPGDPIPGRPVTWFSWHLQSWDPNRDKLATYYHSILKRLVPAR